MEKTTVGASSRTPFKHWLLDASLGKIIGALSTGKTPCNMRIHIVDMCAGDGFGHDGKYDSSPGIIRKHLESSHPASVKVKHKSAHLYEIQAETFERLSSRFGEVPSMNLNLRDSKGWTIGEIKPNPRDCIYIYADPNSVATLPITPEFVNSLTPETLFLMTLGCNASGCKAWYDRGDREEWFKTACMVADSIHRRHDLLLIWLTKDSHQWAYLMSVPLVWSAGMLKDAIRKGNDLWPKGVEGLSLKCHGRKAMNRKFEDLFFTKEENAQ
jgi:hypothetical protein